MTTKLDQQPRVIPITTEDGKEHTVRLLKTFKTLEEAQKYMAEYDAECSRQSKTGVH